MIASFASAEISAIVAEEAFESLRAPIMRVTTPDTQIPFSPALEKQLYPNRTKIEDAVRRITCLMANTLNNELTSPAPRM